MPDLETAALPLKWLGKYKFYISISFYSVAFLFEVYKSL